MLGRIYVRSDVKETICSSGLKGASFVPVKVYLRKSVPAHEPVPQLWELLVHATAWRVGMDLERITLCTICGRTGFPQPDDLGVDEAKWDGSDFFHVDRNPNITLVTEKVAELIETRAFSNVALFPVGG